MPRRARLREGPVGAEALLVDLHEIAAALVREACFQAGNISITDDRVVFVELPHHFLVCAAGRNDDAIFDYEDFYATSTFPALTPPKSKSRVNGNLISSDILFPKIILIGNKISGSGSKHLEHIALGLFRYGIQ
jgi:hypothetical protein